MPTVLFVGVLMFASPIILGCINSGCTQASHDGEVMGVDECITDLYVPICDKDMDGSIDKIKFGELKYPMDMMMEMRRMYKVDS